MPEPLNPLAQQIARKLVASDTGGTKLTAEVLGVPSDIAIANSQINAHLQEMRGGYSGPLVGADNNSRNVNLDLTEKDHSPAPLPREEYLAKLSDLATQERPRPGIEGQRSGGSSAARN